MSYPKLKTYCNPKDGKFNWQKIYDLENFPGKLERYGRVVVTFEKYVPKKSLPQLGYYYGGVLPFLEKELLDDTGMLQDEWHNVLKDRAGKRKTDKTGSIEIVVSLKDYTEKDMSLYIEKIKVLVWDYFKLKIPEPTAIGDYI